ncbi:putative oxidoreductase [Gordonia hirsuta DSM 44140 = NBRC 16056]|uniref:Putative oxidoreductase n=1 Tax=Gordonia hirsuta DSM 44140 = NBRC 16056 TaxID=1121927 RepID=L7LAL0_9ACTN|nr:Gfo/Idh/MocA family oxidoreductase [Gordonia hirsuta]GAC57791.1 putative oxidoreductase [Gordonia hirsuta DSM 44140 = NBRC 16056]
MTEQRALGVAVIGMGWMGAVHARAYSRLRQHYPDAALVPRLITVADDVPGRAAQAAAQYGARCAYEDWRAVLDDPEVEAVSVTVPNFLHTEIGSAVLNAGKHLWIEKPVGLSASDAQAVAQAAATADRQTAVGFNYRHAPAVAAARQIVADGRIGTPTHARFRLFSDYAAHPDGALSWRYSRARGGNGVLGDLASHGADLVRYLLGDIAAVVADTATFVGQRPTPTAATSGHQLATGGVPGPVENEDYAGVLLRLASGARCVLETSRVAVGEQNSYGFEIHGTAGLVRWDYRRMGELELTGSAGGPAEPSPGYQDEPVSAVFVGPGAGDYGSFQPGAANPMSYDDLKVIEAQRFLTSIHTGEPVGATIADAVYAARVLDAITGSAATGAWVAVDG